MTGCTGGESAHGDDPDGDLVVIRVLSTRDDQPLQGVSLFASTSGQPFGESIRPVYYQQWELSTDVKGEAQVRKKSGSELAVQISSSEGYTTNYCSLPKEQPPNAPDMVLIYLMPVDDARYNCIQTRFHELERALSKGKINDSLINKIADTYSESKESAKTPQDAAALAQYCRFAPVVAKCIDERRKMAQERNLTFIVTHDEFLADCANAGQALPAAISRSNAGSTSTNLDNGRDTAALDGMVQTPPNY